MKYQLKRIPVDSFDELYLPMGSLPVGTKDADSPSDMTILTLVPQKEVRPGEARPLEEDDSVYEDAVLREESDLVLDVRGPCPKVIKYRNNKELDLKLRDGLVYIRIIRP